METISQARCTELLGPIDIYLLDQVMKGNLQPGMKVLDAGCGHGRNLYYFIRTGYEVYAVDRNPEYIGHVRQRVGEVSPGYPLDRILESEVQDLPFGDGSFDLVISLAVLHIAPDPETFQAMLKEMWRVVRPEGLLFIRSASTIGLQGGKPLGKGRWLLPDGSERYLLNEQDMQEFMASTAARQVEPVKTTNVQGQRWMTTWVLQKQKVD